MNDEKLLNLAGGKILYKDLRDRIEETAEEITQAAADVLRYTSQDLAEEQKEQARDNIGAVSVEQMDAELNDLWDETNSINDKTDSINDTLAKYNCVELYNPRPASYEDQGISFTWTDHNTCVVTGTPTARALDIYLYVENPLIGNSLGRVRFIHFKSTGDKTKARLQYYADEVTDEPVSGDKIFTIPENCTRFRVGLEVPGGSGEVNETVEIGIFSAPSNMELWNGADGAVKDVQVAGASVVGSDGVANIPIGANAKGVVNVSTNTAYGLQINSSSGFLQLAPASENEIKTGYYSSKPIGTSRQHIATFYGLSKVAGVDLANETVTLGTYPETSKTAIKEMLGVQDGLKVVRLI